VPRIAFETDPSHYRHWKLELRDGIAVLGLAVDEDAGLAPGYALKLNSYDLGVDIELADAIQRLRFEHPEVRALLVTSGKDRIFCSGANIFMLGSSTHAFKVNFCKFTNETRLSLEDASAHSGIRSVGGNMIGVVLNNVDIRTNGYYNYGPYGPYVDSSSHETVVTAPQQKASD